MRLAAQAAPLHQSPVPGWKRTTDSGAVWENENDTDAASSNQDASHLFKQRLPALSLTPRNPPPEYPVQDSNRSPNLSLKIRRIFPSRTRKSESETSSEGLASNSTYKVALPTSTRGFAGGAIAPSAWRNLSIDQDNPWREEISNAGVYKAVSSEMSIEKRTDTSPAPKELTESGDAKPMGRIAPPIPRKRLRSGAPPPTSSSSASRTQTNQSDTLGSHHPHGGYCKGAHKLQAGFVKESVKRRNQSVSMTGQSIYWACASSKCAFEGPACKKGKKWFFDETVRKTDGVQYRWSFLAKCHVASSRVYDGQYDYQCVFCGVQPSSRSVHRGQYAFMEHVSQQHRGQQPDPSIYDKIHCIVGRVALEEEGFDVNLFPKEEEHSPFTSAGAWSNLSTGEL